MKRSDLIPSHYYLIKCHRAGDRDRSGAFYYGMFIRVSSLDLHPEYRLRFKVNRFEIEMNYWFEADIAEYEVVKHLGSEKEFTDNYLEYRE